MARCRDAARLFRGFWELPLRVRPPGIEWKTGRNPKMRNNWPKNRKWSSARNGEKMAKKIEKNDPKSHLFAIFGPLFPHFGPRAIFYFLGQFFPIFGFRPVFHSMPGGLTRKNSLDFQNFPHFPQSSPATSHEEPF